MVNILHVAIYKVVAQIAIFKQEKSNDENTNHSFWCTNRDQ